MSLPFFVGVRYRPPSVPVRWWGQVRPAEVERDLMQARELGITHVDVDVSWEQFQPEPTRLSVPTMRELERVLQFAADNGLRIGLVLFPSIFAGLGVLPPWALTLDAGGQMDLLAGSSRLRRQPRDLYSDELMLGAQERHVREMANAFAQHPAIYQWIIGDRLETVAPCNSRALVTDRWGRLADTARHAGIQGELWVSISAQTLVRSHVILPDILHGLGMRVRVASDWKPQWATDGVWWPAFLGAYAGRLNRQAAAVTDLGFGGNSVMSGGMEMDAANRLERVVHLVHETGGAGCVAASLIDVVPSVAGSRLLGHHPEESNWGLIRSDGGPKPAASVWATAAHDVSHAVPIPADFPDPDPDVVSRDPEGVARECWLALRRL